MHVNGDVDLFDGLVLVNDAHATGSSGAIRVKGKVQLQPRPGRGTEVAYLGGFGSLKKDCERKSSESLWTRRFTVPRA